MTTSNPKAPAATFKPGQSSNPKEKPKGAINKTTRVALELFESGIQNIAAVVR